MRKDSQRGAVAVEFALLLPILVVLVMGIMEFGRAYNAQITLTHSARESVRSMAISNNPVAAKNRAVTTAVGLNPALSPANVAIVTTASPNTACAPAATATVTISYSLPSLTGLFGSAIPLTGKGVMRCGG